MDLNNITQNSFTNISVDDALELLRRIRLSRRTPKKKTREYKAKKAKKNALPKLTPAQAAEVLRMLGEIK